MTLFAVVPVKDLVGTKSRLQPVLNASARAGLTMYMMKNVLSALRGAGVERVCVVSPDRTVLEIAEEAGAATLLQESSGLNPALEEARHWAVERGASSLLVFPADLPLLKAPDVGVVLEAAERAEGPLAVVSPDAERTGTDALLLRRMLCRSRSARIVSTPTSTRPESGVSRSRCARGPASPST